MRGSKVSSTRSKKAFMNTSCELLLEVVTAVCNFILPRLILSHFGSSYNGITTSITQFIGCIALLKSGIGSVTRAALYKPLAEKNYYAISEIANATTGFLRKIAMLFLIIVIAFAGIYPFIVSDEFDWLFSFSLVLILSISTIAQYYFGLTYQMILQADQKNYYTSIASIMTTICNTIISVVMINAGFGIRAVKLGSAIVFTIPPLFFNWYVRRSYRIDSSIPANYELIAQRWDAFGHQVAAFVNQNTDIMVATIFLNIKEVSVYSIYYMIGNALQKFIKAFSTGTAAAFGNMLAKKEYENLKKRFAQYELLMFFLSTFCLTVAAILITPFIMVYTNGINDVNYNRPIFGYLMCIAIYFACVKIPYEQLVYAAGAFHNTRNGAFAEAIINISISVVLVNKIGLNGIVIGTIIAIAYRTLRYHAYVCKHIILRSTYKIVLLFLFTTFCTFICFAVTRLLPLAQIHDYFSWAVWAFIISMTSFGICIMGGFIFLKEDMLSMIKLLSDSVKKFK